MQNSFVSLINMSSEIPADADRGGGRHLTGDPEQGSDSAARVTALLARNCELEGEVEALRAERNRLAEMQSRIMELLHVPSPDKLLHDIRNVLNERELLKALVGDV